MPKRLLAACLLSLVTASAWSDVRGDAHAIAQLVEDNYFDAARAKEIAKELRDKASAGKFDTFTNPLDLAQELTEALKPYDGHFHVSYAPEGNAAEKKPAAPRMSYEVSSRRSN